MSGVHDDGALIGLAVAAAFAAGLIAVAQHANCTTAGYQLAVADRENLELRRRANQAERRVCALSTPQSAMARAVPMKLPKLEYPKRWNVVSAKTIVACAKMETPPTCMVPVPAKPDANPVAR